MFYFFEKWQNIKGGMAPNGHNVVNLQGADSIVHAWQWLSDYFIICFVLFFFSSLLHSVFILYSLQLKDSHFPPTTTRDVVYSGHHIAIGYFIIKPLNVSLRFSRQYFNFLYLVLLNWCCSCLFKRWKEKGAVPENVKIFCQHKTLKFTFRDIITI